MLGNEDVNKYTDDRTFLLGGLAWFFGTSKNEISRNEYIIALNIGKEAMLDKIDDFNDENNDIYKIIDILNIRQEGVRNINK